jgi:two-component system sensor histidine kinase YesM
MLFRLVASVAICVAVAMAWTACSVLYGLFKPASYWRVFAGNVRLGVVIPVARNEMRIVTEYLDSEKTRFGDRLRYAIDIPGALEDLEVPPMAVQTLVKNSIKHAVPRSREVRIAARSMKDRFEIEVSDDGPGFDASDTKEGHGLHSPHVRLRAYSPTTLLWRISGVAGRTTVTISLPRKRVLV